MSEDRPITGELRRAMVEGNYRFDGHHIVREELAIGRERFYGLCDAIDAVHAALEAENAELRAKLDEQGDSMHDGWVELPKDADGEYIHEHDKVDWRDHAGTWHENATVVAVCNDGSYVVDGAVFHVHKSDIRHYHAPTVEDVMVEFATDWESAQDGEDKTAVLKEYAAQLRLAGDAE